MVVGRAPTVVHPVIVLFGSADRRTEFAEDAPERNHSRNKFDHAHRCPLLNNMWTSLREDGGASNLITEGGGCLEHVAWK